MGGNALSCVVAAPSPAKIRQGGDEGEATGGVGGSAWCSDRLIWTFFPAVCLNCSYGDSCNTPLLCVLFRNAPFFLFFTFLSQTCFVC